MDLFHATGGMLKRFPPQVNVCCPRAEAATLAYGPWCYGALDFPVAGDAELGTSHRVARSESRRQVHQPHPFGPLGVFEWQQYLRSR
jgi:hypothetical protein